MIGHICSCCRGNQILSHMLGNFLQVVTLWGVSILCLPLRFFCLFQNHPLGSTFLNPIFSPAAGSSFQVIHYGSEFDLFLFYIPHRERFFYLNLKQIGFFWYFDFFIVMDGGGRWMVKKRLSDFTQTLFRTNFKKDKFLCIEKIVISFSPITWSQF